MLKRTLIVFILLMCYTCLAFAFGVVESTTIPMRVGDASTYISDMDKNGENTIRYLPPIITLTGSNNISLALGDTYQELGAVCSDSVDGVIEVPAPVFTPTLNTNLAGNYSALYTCTNSGSLSSTHTRIVAVGQEAPPGFGPQSSTFAATHGFDFAETFDGLQDWAAVLSSVGNVGENSGDAALMPRLADGSPSAWTYYSKWGVSSDTTPWIGAYGDNRVWRGTKSAAIDLNNRKGPSRFGMLTTNPYKGDLYYFFMVNIPKNEFPTSCGGVACSGGSPTGIYTQGDPYAYIASWKFMSFNYGCETISCWDTPEGKGYSPIFHTITHIKQFGYTTYSRFGLTGVQTGMHLLQETVAHENDTWAISNEGKTSLDAWLGDWWGIEFKLTQNTNGTVTRSIWVYDQAGNVQQRMADQTWSVTGYNAQYGWDFFFHGGNNSGSWSWGPTMESVYYIDDVIIDDQRIGPRYFNAIGVTQ